MTHDVISCTYGLQQSAYFVIDDALCVHVIGSSNYKAVFTQVCKKVPSILQLQTRLV